MGDYYPDKLTFSTEGILGDAIRVAEQVHKNTGLPEWTDLPSRQQKVAARNRLSKWLKPREQEALCQWAKDQGHLLDAREFTEKWKSDGKRGETENEVYYDDEQGTWLKRNDLSYHDTYLSFLQRVALHNQLFPESPLTLLGFCVDRNRNIPERPVMLKPVISQPHVEADRGADTHEVEAMMKGLGYERVSGDDYYHPELNIKVEDLHNENVFMKGGEVYIIDPVIFLDDRGKKARVKGSISDVTAKLLDAA